MDIFWIVSRLLCGCLGDIGSAKTSLGRIIIFFLFPRYSLIILFVRLPKIVFFSISYQRTLRVPAAYYLATAGDRPNTCDKL